MSTTDANSSVAACVEAAPAGSWLAPLRADPLGWLLEPSEPAVRHMALRELCNRPAGDPELREARRAAMAGPPIATILAMQEPEGYWLKPGAGYAPKYRGTVWSLIFLDQLGADGDDPRVRQACKYVLSHTQSESGGFGSSGSKEENVPPPSRAIHCLHGNILRALLDFGLAHDPRVQSAIDWLAGAITGEGGIQFYRSGTSGPGFCCAANDHLPCAWAAIPAMAALARVPATLRTPPVERAIEQGVAFLLSRDPAIADYPMGYGNARPNGSWFKPGFPMSYVADVLRNLEVLCELGMGQDPRLGHAVEWLLTKQDDAGRWKNENTYRGKTWFEADPQGGPSKWVTLRACRVIKAVYGGGSPASRAATG